MNDAFSAILFEATGSTWHQKIITQLRMYHEEDTRNKMFSYAVQLHLKTCLSGGFFWECQNGGFGEIV